MKTVIDKVTKSNMEVIVEQLQKMLDQTIDTAEPLFKEAKGGYTPEQLVLESRMLMLVEALTSLRAFLESDCLTPDNIEKEFKDVGIDPREHSRQARNTIMAYNHTLMKKENPEITMFMDGLVETLLKEIFGSKK